MEGIGLKGIQLCKVAALKPNKHADWLGGTLNRLMLDSPAVNMSQLVAVGERQRLRGNEEGESKQDRIIIDHH